MVVGTTDNMNLVLEESKIGFVYFKITKKHIGGFNEFSGLVSIVDGKMTEVKTIIYMSSVEADHPKLTRYLKTAAFFDVGIFTEATFTSNNTV